MPKTRSDTLQLAECLDLAAAAPLRAEILARRGSPLVIDGSRVQRAGGLCLQVLLAARSTWRSDEQSFSLTGASPDFRNCLERSGAGDMIEGIG
jgi:chemotaxis protein CheX